jgi:alpha-soluble NSF attachment protein
VLSSFRPSLSLRLHLRSRLQAETILKKGGGFMGLFGGGTDKYEDAAAAYNKAGLAFKAVKKWDKAAEAYSKAGECFVKCKSEGEAGNAYTEAARAWVKAGDGKAATELLTNEALPRMIEAGRLSQAAKTHNEIAELLEADNMIEDAIENFEKAADLFAAENTTTSMHKCLIKAAHLYAMTEPPSLEKAAELFIRVGQESLSNNLLKFSAKGHFFEAFLCTLARTDVVAAEMQLNRTKDMDYTFPGSRECKLCEDILQAFKDMNAEAFTDAVYNFDQIQKLDPWKTT